MSFKVSNRGDVYFVEDTAGQQVIGRFRTREEAEALARTEAARQADYFKGTKANISIQSKDMNINV